MPNTPIIEITATIFGLIGTILLALKTSHAGWGFVAFLVSNAGWLTFSAQHDHWFMFTQQLGFSISSLLGVWVWLVKPALTMPPKPHPNSSQRAFCGHGNTSAGVERQNASERAYE